MPRAARRLRWTDAACYHVLNRGHARETVFHDDADRAHFLRLLGRYRDRFGFALYHYRRRMQRRLARPAPRRA